MSMQVYLDYAATTFTAPEVVTAMTPFFTESFGNPSSIYSFSERNRKAIAKARQQVADVIGASADEIFFTSGGTEADNWALKGAAWRGRSKGYHNDEDRTSCRAPHSSVSAGKWIRRHISRRGC